MAGGYLNAAGREIRLGRVQRQTLDLCAAEPQRRCPGNPTMRALSGHGFVSSEQHYSPRLKRHTTDRMFAITAEGQRYLEQGRDR
jgi:hypothetical protein